jgi:hypothetical protein
VRLGAENDKKNRQSVAPAKKNWNALPFGRMRYTQPNNAVGYAKFLSRPHDAVISVYDEAGNVIATHEHGGDVRQVLAKLLSASGLELGVTTKTQLADAHAPARHLGGVAQN